MTDRLANVEDFYPLAPMQQGMLYHTLASPHGDAYCQQAAFVIEGSVDVDLLRQAWQYVVDLHAVLRTSFVWKGLAQPVQVVRHKVTVALRVEDCHAGPSTQAAVTSALSSERQAGFDLSRAPAMRLLLIREADQVSRLVWTYHHVILDGFSANRVLGQVLDAYRCLADGRQPEAEPSPPYSDYVRWLARQDHAAALSYWRHALAGYSSPTPLGVDRSHDAGETDGDTVATETVRLSADVTAGLERLGRTYKLTLNTIVQGGFGLLLSWYSGRNEVIFGSTVSTRPADLGGVSESVGVFINTVPVRLQMSDEAEVVPWLQELQNAQAEARLYDYTSLVDIHSLTGVPRDRPLFDSILVFGNYGGESPVRRDVGPLQIRDYWTWESSNYALNAFAEPGTELTLGAVYLCSRFDAITMQRLLRHWATLLEEMTASDRRLVDLTPVDDAERRTLIVEANDTDREYPGELGIPELVRARGFSDGTAVAVSSPDGDLTYAELDRRARSLAAHLTKIGLGGGDYVGVHLRRCPELVVAVLGVLDSGAAFVPLDPEWPAVRTRGVLARLGISCVVTDRTQSRRLHDACRGLTTRPDLVYLDVDEPRVPMEPLDRQSVLAFWDHLALTTQDRVSAAGFVSEETGDLFSEQDVDQYVERVVALALEQLQGRSPARVLEIGCGSGLVMHALAPQVDAYIGVDPSPATQRRNRETLDRDGLGHVALRTGFADELDDLEPGSLDLVILASVAQFFPGPAYFERVIERALEWLAPGGALLLCDLIDPSLHDADEPNRGLADRVGPARADRVAAQHSDAEFCVDEAYLRQLADTWSDRSTLTVLPRTDRFTNELRFRYDAVLLRDGEGEDDSYAVRTPTSAISSVWTRWHLDRTATPARAVTGAQRIAYVIHTSGSTGEPKGVMVGHRPVVNLIDWVNRSFSVDSSDCLLWTTSLCFDLSIYDIFGLLAAGGTIRIATEMELADPAGLATIMATEPITFWDSAPAALQRVTPFLPAAVDQVEQTSLRLVFLSGDWIPVALPDEVRGVFPDARVIALGGATEATVWSNFYPIGDVAPDWPSVPYGRPIQNARYYVLDRRQAPVPTGVPGELYIGGECLSAGYVGDPGATAEKFRPDPFATRDGARMYRTGDRVRVLPDGNLQFLGRVDRQLKIRGHRIEPGEIESALTTHAAVDHAVVVGAERVGGDWRLSAYLVGAGEQRPVEGQLRHHLLQRVPAYMVPSAYIWLDAIPMTPNGKLDRSALPDPFGSTRMSERPVSPMTDLERTIAALWCDVLGVDEVGRDDNFFDLGGHSLLLIQLHGKLQKAIREDIAVVSIFRYPTVATLAEHLSGEEDTSRTSSQARVALAPTVARAARRRLASRGGEPRSP